MTSKFQNLFPVQIENALTAHDAIQEAAAVAVPDDVFGEAVGVWIVRNPLEAGSMTREGVRELVRRVLRPQVS
jgi:acyl-CoA synthetase (AMP-forming)/AMP-acid ligase II